MSLQSHRRDTRVNKHPMTASTIQIRLLNAQHAVPLAWAPGPGRSPALQSLLA